VWKRLFSLHGKGVRTPWNMVGRVVEHGGLVARALSEAMFLRGTKVTRLLAIPDNVP
jgi:hypothetical protein